MSEDTVDQARRFIVGEYVEWVKRFDVNDYLKNKPMIEKLYEEKQLALATSLHLEDNLKDLQTRVHELEVQNKVFGVQLEDASRKSNWAFFLSLLATVLVGFGINIVTTTSDDWKGWVMVVSACVLEIVAFLSRPKRG
jgi:hypothetical protein